MGISQSMKTIISYSDIKDISNTIFKKSNCPVDAMERGVKQDNIVINIMEEKYWRDRKLHIDYKNKKKRVCNRRKREIFKLKKEIQSLENN